MPKTKSKVTQVLSDSDDESNSKTSINNTQEDISEIKGKLKQKPCINNNSKSITDQLSEDDSDEDSSSEKEYNSQPEDNSDVGNLADQENPNKSKGKDKKKNQETKSDTNDQESSAISDNKLKNKKSSRPLTAYNFYMIEQMKIVEIQNPKEKLKVIGKMWSDLNDQDKISYISKAKIAKEEWEAQSNDSKELKKTAKGKKSKKNPDSKKEKKPPSAYNLFMKDRMKDSTMIADSQSEKLKLIAQLWKKLPENDKQPFIDQCQQIKEQLCN